MARHTWVGLCSQVRVRDGAGVRLQSWVLRHSEMAMGEYGPSLLCMFLYMLGMSVCQYVCINVSMYALHCNAMCLCAAA